jgi:hypothetical protein
MLRSIPAEAGECHFGGSFQFSALSGAADNCSKSTTAVEKNRRLLVDEKRREEYDDPTGSSRHRLLGRAFSRELARWARRSGGNRRSSTPETGWDP